MTAWSVAVTSAHGVGAGTAGVPGLELPVLASTALAGTYLVGAVRYRRLRLRPWSAARTIAFVSGTALLTLALSSTGEALAGGGARGHMAQHVAIGMLAPIGLVLGAPVTLFLGVASARARRRAGRLLAGRGVHVLAHPVTSAVLNVGGMYLLYLTPLYARSVESTAVHHAVHLHFVLAGSLFAWAIAGPDPAPRRPGVGVRVVVLVLAAGAHSHLAKLLYAGAGELPPGSGHGVPEMEVAAQWMYYGGDVAELALAAALFATWYRSAGHRLRRAEAAGLNR